ncbi:MAG TPA: 3-oxoacyl-[acyl-carrier-protein] synthase III C-terminal domain-containing protein, partial [Chloroflexota bacterium]|nr:3-oxoacyl-[acyl-carrier-protein] synthase III C-terminal domain-containing protein [Chloroflexota bacterium]
AAGIDTADLDVLICAGVDRGFAEPATAYLVAQACDLGNISCFDVADACNGWTRAIQIVDAMFRGGVYRRALIVNAEFPMVAGGAIYPGLFSLRHRGQLAWSFAGFTLGEGVTATIVSAHPNNQWEFHFSSRPDLADQSTVPLVGYQRYCRPSERIGINGIGRFAAFSGAMFAEAVGEIQSVFRRLTVPIGDVRAIFPHGATKRTWDLGAEPLGVRDRLYHVYPRFGNLISASIPAGLATAIDEGILRRGDRAIVCGASAGMSFSACSFVY